MGWFLLSRRRQDVFPQDCPQDVFPQDCPSTCPHHHHHETNECKTVIMRLGLIPQTQFSGINTSRHGGRLQRVLGEEGNSSAMSTLALQAMPLWPGVRQCLLVRRDFTRGRGDSKDRLGRPRRRVQEGDSFLTPAVDVGTATFTHGQCMARSNLNHAEWQGGVEGSK